MSKRKHRIKIFDIVNYTLLTVVAAICIIPFINTIAVSLSSKSIAATGSVGLWPKEFTLTSYEYVLQKNQFWASAIVSIKRVLLGGMVNMVLIILTAYPLSMKKQFFRARYVFMLYFLIPMIFSGGLIPTYMTIRRLGLINTIWSLVFPVGLPVYNVILLQNFFRQLPGELNEASYIDGANHFQILFRIYLPLTKPALATITLLVFVFHWNSWFDGMIYMSDINGYPLQSYIRSVTTLPAVTSMTMDEVKMLQIISDRTMKSAQVVIASIPILAIYPFLQRYFVKGMVLGSVKG